MHQIQQLDRILFFGAVVLIVGRGRLPSSFKENVAGICLKARRVSGNSLTQVCFFSRLSA